MILNRPEALAELLLAAYHGYVRGFHEITRRAGARFEARDWNGSVEDSLARLRLYKQHIDAATTRCGDLFAADARRADFWEEAKAVCQFSTAGRYDADLASMFVDSVMRRALAPDVIVPYASAGVDPKLDPAIGARLAHRHVAGAGVALNDLVTKILRECGFQAPWRDLDGDARSTAAAIEESLQAVSAPRIDSLEVLRPLFYRNKGAYVVGRIHTTSGTLPLAVALGHEAYGIVVDAVLTEESDLRRIFSYTRSNFHVELEGQYRELLEFLRSLMPRKNWAALYSSIGFMNPAKIQLARDLEAHRHRPGTKLREAWGIPGLVMSVFTSTGFPYVFKVIRDDDKVTKRGYIGRLGVRDKYRLVQEGDRVGRLLDTITCHHLRFARQDFEPNILRELLETASASVKAVGDDIVITHCYAQREATPLPMYLHQCEWPETQRVLNDLGWCLKQMAAAGLFPGEFDLKNFGVAEDGRVVFFDFDGLDELGRFTFEDVRLEASLGQEECFEYLLHAYRVSLIDVFRRLHPDLFMASHWRRIQRLLEEGEVLDTFPYPAHKRLRSRNASTGARVGRTAPNFPPLVEAGLDRLGLGSTHRKGLIVWESVSRGIAVGRASLDALSPPQRGAVRQTFAVDENTAEPPWLAVIIVDGMPAFLYLGPPSTSVIDLSAQYGIDKGVAASWRERVERAVFRGTGVEFSPFVPVM